MARLRRGVGIRTVGVVLVSMMLASPAVGAIVCQKKSGKVFVRDACRKKEVAVDPITVGLQATIQDGCAPGQVLQGVGPDGTVVCTPAFPEGAVTSDAIADVVRTLAFPAGALAFNPGTLTQEFDGLRWGNITGPARLIIPRLADWDGVSDVRVRIFFYPTTATAGTVQFFIRPRIYDPGDTFQDAVGEGSAPVPVGVADEYNELQIAIPADRFGAKAWWYLVLQRTVVGAPDLYPDDVVIVSIAIDYTAVR